MYGLPASPADIVEFVDPSSYSAAHNPSLAVVLTSLPLCVSLLRVDGEPLCFWKSECMLFNSCVVLLRLGC